ncbi:MAG TPA: valine--tRNA ligase [Candidatus Paceibacterota bacterium]|nr:valine--tRNA ligase [Candidatus Paceibacterota bacterium]
MAETNFKEIELKWKEYWEKEKIYAFNPNKTPIYSIDIPPPTVSGKMHIGHAFSYSQQDFIVRFRRMKENVYYPFGTDDNGLPTERLIEKINNIKSKNMSRAEFIDLCLKTLKKITPDFIDDWKTLGISADYNLIYSTINDNSRKLSQAQFIELYKKGEIYKKEMPTIWCTECQTSIAQAELEDKEENSLFSTLKFHVDEKELLIATTRPELLGACVAVFVNPKDKRYKWAVGKKAKIPLFNFEVPILEDESAEIDKGTGVLMICSYGDKFDVDAINRHKLKPKIVFNSNGTLNIGNYKGMKIKEARKKILENLKEADLITEQKQISHIVNIHDKCGTEIEFIPTEQWFIKLLDKKKKFIEQGKKIKWYPEYMFKRYENWVNGLDWDWSISRDRHFGIPIPVWKCPQCGEIILPSEKELPVDPMQTEKKCLKCKCLTEPETKVLDTWATSSISPQIASSLVNNKVKIPYSLRPQAHDIIRTWAFYTIVRSYLIEKEIPWKEITISGFVTLGGEKMSKSKGNVISPQEVIEKYSADAIRYWAASSKLGEDLDYQEKDVLTGKKFSTKILNASNFVFMNLKYQKKQPKLCETDRILLNELNKLIKISTESFEKYNYAKAKLETDSFFWTTFCDNYLEIVKNRVYNGTDEEKNSAYYTLYHTLLTITKLMAPITPYITEEIYQTHFRKNEGEKSVHLETWPEEFKILKQKNDDVVWSKLIELIGLVRQKKSEAKKSMKTEIILTISKEDTKFLEKVLDDLKSVTNAKELKQGNFNVDFL